MRKAWPFFFAFFVWNVGCSSGDPPGDGSTSVPADGDADVDSDRDADGDAGDSDGSPDIPFAVTGVQPSHGVFSGLTPVVVRGRGFEEGARLFFGDQEVSPDTLVVLDENRIGCLTPPGEPGSVVDVSVVQDDEPAVLEQGFLYDPCTLSPDAGSVSGGTYVIIECLGTDIEEGVEVAFDSTLAQDVERVSPTEVHLRTPPGPEGTADVVIMNNSEEIDIENGFSYHRNTDPLSAGLGGDPVVGNIEVTVLDFMNGAPLSESFVILGVDGGTEYQGWTDENGSVVFSGPDLSGRQVIITASHAPVPTPLDTDCDDVPDLEASTSYETASFTEFDATFVTVLLEPVPPPIPIPPCETPPEPPESFIEGELLFDHEGEFGPYEWSAIPDPAENEVKVAYVFTTANDIHLNEDAGETFDTGTIPGGTGFLVTEDDAGVEGFHYRIRSRYGALAVYAMAGIEHRITREFTPYIFGIHRGVLVPPGETVTQVDMFMSVGLDEIITVSFDGAPIKQGYDLGPNEYRAEVYMDLGVEGVIWRPDRLSISSLSTATHTFAAWMAPEGDLEDASVTVVAQALSIYTDPGTGQQSLTYPFSMRYERGVRDWLTPLVVGDWIGRAEPVDPSDFGTVVDSHFEWEPGTGDFDYTHVMVNRAGPYWDIVLPGSQVEVVLPPLPAELEPPATSESQFDVWHHRMLPGFEYDRWSYQHLGLDAHEAFTATAWIIYF